MRGLKRMGLYLFQAKEKGKSYGQVQKMTVISKSTLIRAKRSFISSYRC